MRLEHQSFLFFFFFFFFFNVGGGFFFLVVKFGETKNNLMKVRISTRSLEIKINLF